MFVSDAAAFDSRRARSSILTGTTSTQSAVWESHFEAELQSRFCGGVLLDALRTEGEMVTLKDMAWPHGVLRQGLTADQPSVRLLSQLGPSGRF